VSQAAGTPQVLCVTPVLAEEVRNYLLALIEADLLQQAVSSLAYGEGTFTDRVLTALRLRRQTERRRLDARYPRGRVVSWPWPELRWQARRWWSRGVASPAEIDRWLGAVDQAASRRVGAGVRLVLGREDCSLHTFQAARRAGAQRLYELAIPHYATVRRLMAQEAEAFPDAADSILAEQEYDGARNARKDAEVQLADHFLAPSQFVRDSLTACGVAAERITTIPYACSPVEPAAADQAVRKPLVLYVGHLSLRKGTLRLLRVWRRLGAYRTHQLRLIGKLHLPARCLDEYAGTFEHIPHLPRPELWQHYAAARLFVFPSAADGFGVVINEALACGTPVVASSNTGAPGFLTPGVEGLIYPFGDDDALAAALDQMLTRTDETAAMGRAAIELARRWPWEKYREAFRGLVSRLLDNRA